jgi:hypothetical protein
MDWLLIFLSIKRTMIGKVPGAEAANFDTRAARKHPGQGWSS